MLGKIIDGVLVTPSENERKKIVISNPTDEQLKLIMGYKDLVINEQPEISEEQYLEPVYEETDNCIIKHWEIKDIAQNDVLSEDFITEAEDAEIDEDALI